MDFLSPAIEDSIWVVVYFCFGEHLLCFSKYGLSWCIGLYPLSLLPFVRKVLFSGKILSITNASGVFCQSMLFDVNSGSLANVRIEEVIRLLSNISSHDVLVVR